MAQRFFFDTFNGTVVHDDEGCVLPDVLSARSEALRRLQAMVGHTALERNATEVRADVRDESGRRVFSARICLMFEAS